MPARNTLAHSETLRTFPLHSLSRSPLLSLRVSAPLRGEVLTPSTPSFFCAFPLLLWLRSPAIWPPLHSEVMSAISLRVSEYSLRHIGLIPFSLLRPPAFVNTLTPRPSCSSLHSTTLVLSYICSQTLVRCSPVRKPTSMSLMSMSIFH